VLLLGKLFDASHAHAIGLVNRVVDDEAALENEVRTIVSSVLQGAPDAITETKSGRYEVADPAMPRPTVDLNSLLQAANVVVAGLLLWGLSRNISNEYVEPRTLTLGFLLCLQTHVGLILERVRRDPFVLLFAFSMIFYCALRIFTLAVVPFSLVFDRFGFGPENANYALVFIIVANVFLYAGLLVVRFPDGRRIDASEWRAVSPSAVIALMVVAFPLAYFSGDYWTVERLPRAVTVLRVLLVPDLIVPMALAYYLLFRKSLTRRAAFAIGSLLLLEAIAHTLWGSRSAVSVLIQTFLLVAIAVWSSVKVRRRYVLLGVGLLPVVAVLMVAAFAISTYNRLSRQVLGDTQALNVGFAIQSAREGSSGLVNQGLDVVLPPVLARAGFFDFSAELIAHRDQYSTIINLPGYAKSIIDNVLTPGFDVFDQPRMSNALRFLYLGRGAPSKAWAAEEYHSDQLGIYGEFYTLFAWASLPLFFLVPYLLKRFYVRLRAVNPFILAMKRIAVLLVFVKLVDSFGVDWIIGEMVPFVVAIVLYSVFFSSRRVASTEGSSLTPLPPGLSNA
jgi:hypothetical protein